MTNINNIYLHINSHIGIQLKNKNKFSTQRMYNFDRRHLFTTVYTNLEPANRPEKQKQNIM